MSDIDYELRHKNVLDHRLEMHPSSAGLQFPGDYFSDQSRAFLRGMLRLALWKVGGLRHGQSLKPLRQLRDSAVGSEALVVANGPSAELLSAEELASFVANGNQIFLLNDFTPNQVLDGQWRFNYVTSDPNMLRRASPRLKKALRSTRLAGLFCPTSQATSWSREVATAMTVAFCDVERKPWSRRTRCVRPDQPRSYGSWTALKALAIATWMGFDCIHIVGFDNSMLRELYSDRQNRILTFELHAGETPFLRDRTETYASMADYILQVYELFRGVEVFRGSNVVNLDPYSLTNVFPKAQKPWRIFG